MVNLRALIPPMIADMDRDKPWQEWRWGTVFFCDVSGFTAMAETLSVLGAEGAELLTDILNRYFTDMIAVVHAHGGQVMKFGGDAILCFFPENGDWHMRSEAEACLSPLSGGGARNAERGKRKAEGDQARGQGSGVRGQGLEAREQGIGVGGQELKLEGARRNAGGGAQKAEGGREDAGDVAAPFMGVPSQAEACGTISNECHPELDSGSSIISALHAALLMQKNMTRFQNIRTPVKRFALKMKIGIAHGEVLLAGVGEPDVRCDYVFAGEPVDRAAEAEHRASAGEIVLAGDKFQVPSSKFQVEEIEGGFWRVLEAAAQLGTRNAERGEAEPQPETRNSRPETLTQTEVCGYIPPPSAFSLQPSALQPYLIREVYEMVSAGQARHVGTLLEAVPVFVRFSGFSFRRDAFDLERFHAFFCALMRTLQPYGGRLNRLSMGDKGNTLLLLFGAPNPLEQKEHLACQWALDALALVAGNFPGVELSAGMHTGRLFSGIVGARDRAEYTVMGDAVNLAARLMERAGPGEVCVSGDLTGRATEHFIFDRFGTVQVKGKATALEVFNLRERRQQTRILQAREALVGREREMESLAGLLEGAANGVPALAVLEGEAGVGKSFLAGHLLDRARKGRWRIIPARGEITRSTHAYAPWAEVLKHLLFGGRDPDWKALEEALGPESKPFLPWYAALFGTTAPEGVRPPEMDEETRKNLLHHQISDLILARGARQPLLIFLDDLHWFDTLSLELLSGLLNHLRGHRVFLLATTRPAWNNKGIAGRPGCHVQPLAAMDRPSVKALAEEVLRGPMREELAGFLLEKTGGNPFFTRELIAHLAAEKALVSRLGEWMLDRTVELRALPTGSDLIVSHLERLDVRQQIQMRMAACMGPTFSLEVLRKALGRNFSNAVLESILRLGHFQRLTEDDCTFPHALVQESLYQSIPLRQRRLNHRRIAAAMERVYAGRLDAYAPNLANHHHLAGNRPKAVAYSLQAGRDLFARLSFPEACTYFERAYRLLRHRPGPEKFSTGLGYAQALLRAGRLKESQALAMRIKGMTEGIEALQESHVEACLIRFHAMEMLGNYKYVVEAQRMLDALDPSRSEATLRLRYLAGFALFRRGDYDAAEGHFLGMLGGEDRHPALVLDAYLPLASIEKSRGRWDNAFNIIQMGSALAGRLGNIYQELRLRIEYANICIESGALDKADAHLEHTLSRMEEIGDFYLLANIYYNLGKLRLNRGHLDRAEELLKESAGLCLNLGIINGQANAMMNLGIVYFFRRQYFDAYTYYFEATHLFESIHEIPDLCHGYYNLAEVCLNLGKNEEAKEWHQKGIKLFKAEDNPELFRLYQELAGSL